MCREGGLKRREDRFGVFVHDGMEFVSESVKPDRLLSACVRELLVKVRVSEWRLGGAAVNLVCVQDTLTGAQQSPIGRRAEHADLASPLAMASLSTLKLDYISA